MTPVRNGIQFQNRLRQIHRDYKNRISPYLKKLRQSLAEQGGPPSSSPEDVDEALEAHARTYIINGFLKALNWPISPSLADGLPRVVVEVAVASLEKGTTRFLDYLGLDQSTDKPLLIVEAKRPSARLPGKTAGEASVALARGLDGERLGGGWDSWLNDLRDYVRSCYSKAGQAPRRVMMSNGTWLVLFLDPNGTFLPGSTPSPATVRVYVDRDDIERDAREIFHLLEHSVVQGEVGALSPGGLLFHVRPDQIDAAMFGLHLSYRGRRTMYGNLAPEIEVAPIVVLHTSLGSWFNVERQGGALFLLPAREAEKIPEHLAAVDKAANDLLQDVSQRLGKALVPSPVFGNGQDACASESRSLVVEQGYDVGDGLAKYYIRTGDRTHFLAVPEPTVQDCPFHRYDAALAHGVAGMHQPVHFPSTEPRSFFASGDYYHCAHGDVIDAKTYPVVGEEVECLGDNGAVDEGVVCEVARWEELLCCRACAFQHHCTSIEVFALPCSPWAGGARGNDIVSMLLADAGY